MGKGISETLLGLVVIVVALLFALYAYKTGNRNPGQDQYGIDAVFSRVDGISTGSEVRIAGIRVGTVSGSRLLPDTYEAALELRIASGIRVPADSVAKIVSSGLIGGAHVSIEPGGAEEMLADGDTLTITQGSVDILGLAVQAFTKPAGSAAAPAGSQTGMPDLF